MEMLSIHTNMREEIINITPQVLNLLDQLKPDGKAILLYCPHTTCGLTINESADPAVKLDLIKFFREIAPFTHDWKHAEGNTDAHIRASLLGSSLMMPINEGKLCLGVWQAIYLYEGDGPRTRKVLVQML